MKNIKKELLKKTDEIFNLNSKLHVSNKMETNVKDMVQKLLKNRAIFELITTENKQENLNNLSKEDYLTANHLNVFSFFLSLVNNNASNVEEQNEGSIILATQFLLSLRINDLEDIIDSIKDIIKTEEDLNIERKREIVNNTKKTLDNKIKEYNNLSKNIFELLNSFFSTSENFLDDNKLEFTKNLFDEIIIYDKKINKNSIEEWHNFILHFDNEMNNNIDKKIKEEYIKIKEIYQTNKENDFNFITTQYIGEYIAIVLSERIFDLEILLQEYLYLLEK